MNTTIDTTTAPDIDPTAFGQQVTVAPSGTSFIAPNGTYYNALGLESTETMRHVSVIWQKKCVPFTDFAAHVHAQAAEKRDVNVSLAKLKLNDDLTLTLDGHTVEFTWSGLKSLPRDSMREGFLQHLVQNVKNYDGDDAPIIAQAKRDAAFWLNREIDRFKGEKDEKLVTRKAKYELELKDARTPSARKRLTENIADMDARLAEPASVLLRLRGDGNGGNVARFCGSAKYGVLDNVDVMGWLREAIPGGVGDALASHIQNDGDNIWGNILLPDYMKSRPDSDYGVGIAFKNSEVGEFQFEICPFVFRAICLNGCVWGRQDMVTVLKKKHIGKLNLDEIGDRVKELVKIALNGGHQLLERMDDTHQVAVTDHNPIIAYVSDRNGLTLEQSRAWASAISLEPGDEAFYTVQGLTRAAQKFDGEKRLQMETVAGSILAPSLDASLSDVLGFWENLKADAAKMDAEKVSKLVTAK